MKVVILYHPNSEHARTVEEYAHEFQKTKGKALQLVSLDEKAGADLAKLYDITLYPAVLALDDKGGLLTNWQGDQLPLMNDLSAYV